MEDVEAICAVKCIPLVSTYLDTYYLNDLKADMKLIFLKFVQTKLIIL